MVTRWNKVHCGMIRVCMATGGCVGAAVVQTPAIATTGTARSTCLDHPRDRDACTSKKSRAQPTRLAGHRHHSTYIPVVLPTSTKASMSTVADAVVVAPAPAPGCRSTTRMRSVSFLLGQISASSVSDSQLVPQPRTVLQEGFVIHQAVTAACGTSVWRLGLTATHL